MINIKKFNFLGGRIIKTGIAVFLTALICQSIGWPYMLAVITAIVTIEPQQLPILLKKLSSAFLLQQSELLLPCFTHFY
ncbi:aromatic acid exporter family protein [Priestia megaterium]|uniref:aromatic acid exporter family protein n=1 Tax=Priestia megaterium TaxID=1404 RepID=UPI001FB4479F|nr:aromatic acid exporter family protein [Priestia megaterium]